LTQWGRQSIDGECGGGDGDSVQGVGGGAVGKGEKSDDVLYSLADEGDL